MPTFVPSDVQIKNNPTLMVVDAKRVKGSYMVFADTAARDALDPSVRQSGMKVRTLSPDSEWTLNNDLTTWTMAVGGGVGGENGAEHRAARKTELYATREAVNFFNGAAVIHSIAYRRAYSTILSPQQRDELLYLAFDGSPRGLYSLDPVTGVSTPVGPTALPQGLLFVHAEHAYILVGTPNGGDGTPSLPLGGVYDTLFDIAYTINGAGSGIEGFPQAATVQWISGDTDPQTAIFVMAHTNTAGTYGGGVYYLLPGMIAQDLQKVVDFDGEATSSFFPEAICAGEGASFWVLFRNNGGNGGLLRQYSYGTLGAGNWTNPPQVASEIDVGHPGHHILFDGRYVWVLGYQKISRVSMNGTVTTLNVGTPGFDIDFRSSLAWDGLTIWATFRGGYVRIDPETMKFLSQNYNTTGSYMGEIVCSPDLDNTRVFYLEAQDASQAPVEIIWSLTPFQKKFIPDPNAGSFGGELLFYKNSDQQWSALTPGTISQSLQTLGTGADPIWTGLRFPVATVNGTTYPSFGYENTILCSNTSGCTVTLPSPPYAYVGKSIVIKNINGVSNSVLLVDPNGSTIDGVASTIGFIGIKAGAEFVYTDNNNWVIINQYGAATNLFFQSEAQGDLTYRGTNSWVRLGAGTSGQVLRTNGVGSAPAWTNQLVFSGEAQGDIAYRNATTWVRLPAGTAGQVLTTGGAGANPSWAAGGGGGGASPDNAVSARFSSAGKSSGFLGLPTSSPSLTTAFAGFGTGYRGAAFDDQFIYWLDPTAQGVYLTDAVSPGFGGGSGPNQLLFVSAAYQQILYLGYQRGSSNVKRFVMMGTGGVRFFDYNTSTATATLGVQSISTSVAGGWFDGNNLWVVLNSAGTNQVQRINTVLRNSGSPTITTITGTGTVFSKNTQLFSPIITSDGTNLWVIDQRASSGTFSLYKIVMSSGTVTSNAWAGGVIDPRSICFDGRYLWVGGISSTVYRCDPTATNPTPGTAIQMTEGGTVNGGAGGGSTVDNILWDGRRVILSMSDCTSTTANSVFAIDPDYASQLTDPGNTFVGAVQGINGPRGLVASNMTSGGASTIYVIATSGLHRITEPLPVEATDLVVRGAHIDTNSRTVSGASVSYNILQSDYIINVNATGSTLLTLPTSPRVGYQCIVKDISGAASVNNINIGATSGSLEGSSSFNGYVIGTNYGSIGLIHLGSNVWVTF